MYYSGLLSWIILGYIPVRSEGFCVARLLIGNSTSQNITGRCRSHLIQKFRPRSSSVRKDVIKPAGVFKHMNGGNWWQDSRSGWLPSVIPPETCIGSLAHPYRTPDNEQWRRPLTIRIQPLIRQPRPAAVWPQYYYSMLLTLYVRMFWHYYYCYSSMIIITITIIPFLTSPSVTNSRHSCV